MAERHHDETAQTNTDDGNAKIVRPLPGWVRWLYVVAWMAVIFGLSADPRSNAETTEILGTDLNFWVRKAAHMTEYAILLALAWNALRAERSNSVLRFAPPMVLAFLISVLYAASDEWHQSFVPGRTATIKDVFIDSAGALCGIAAIFLVRWIKPRRKETDRS